MTVAAQRHNAFRIVRVRTLQNTLAELGGTLGTPTLWKKLSQFTAGLFGKLRKITPKVVDAFPN